MRYYLPTGRVEDYNVMIDGRNSFHQPIKNDIKTYENTRKIATGQVDDYITGYLPGYNYFINHYKMIAIDLCKQQVLDADPKAIQVICFTGTLKWCK